MKARIYQPAKTAMQSGRAGAQKWMLEFEQQGPRRPESLMGWVSAADTMTQVRVGFDSQEAAMAFARDRGFDFEIVPPQARRVRPRSYLDNFKFRSAEEQA